MSWAETSAVPIRNNAGEVTGFIGTTIDVTQHKLWEGELERANRQVSDVLESITEMFIAVDYEWQFTYANRATVEKRSVSRSRRFWAKISGIFTLQVRTFNLNSSV